MTPEEFLAQLIEDADGEPLLLVVDPPSAPAVPAPLPVGKRRYKQRARHHKPSESLVILETARVPRGTLTPIELKRREQVRITTNAFIRHIDRETRGGVELAEIALAIMRDPCARAQDRLTAIDLVANRVFGVAGKEATAELVQRQLDQEKEKLLKALRAALSEDDVRRIEEAMAISGATLVKVETRGGRPRGT